MLIELIILLLIVGAFISGLALAGMYWKRLINEWRYTCKILASERGLGYISPPVEKSVLPIGQDFMDKLKENGRAITAIRSPRN